MHPAQLPSPRHPYAVQPGQPASVNPLLSEDGGAAMGAAVGALFAGMIGGPLARALFPAPPKEVEVTAELTTEGEFKKILDVEKTTLDATQKARNRKVQAVSGVVSVIGAATGAALFAAEGKAVGAAVGAAAGTGLIQVINVLAGQTVGLSGFVSGGVGAYLGSRSA